ncbi:MAG: hypothetical protein JGK30_25990 [Microcoleus sp. PH2017_40_RAT_O_B]|uniref:hypothetical protein n=1 Tax=unclassified Microcoleus TaxID=2642155 RepID=UPI001D3A659D|nr:MULTISPECIES: hypothetical protein [unclassified Microcoleus]MCC3575249.1 hypothetical protein [Microcoleus sp. PH2017_34_RAT_O_A]MCC3612827.1 hypothetical protein [Microcoleus sp. PH2017_40_RAT_O_B]
MKLSLTLEKVEDTRVNKRQIYCQIKVEFKLYEIFKWNCFIKISHYIRTIKDLIKIGKCKDLKETLQNIESPSTIPPKEKQGIYEKFYGKIIS